MDTSTWLGPLCAFAASITWAVGSAQYSRLSRGHSPFAVNLARATVALPLFLVCSMWMAGGPVELWVRVWQMAPTQVFWLAVSIFASYGMGDVLFMWSTRSLGVPAALAIGSTYPLLTAGVGTWIQGEPITFHQIVGLFLTVGGVIAVILSGSEPTPASSSGLHAAPKHLTRRGLGVALAFGTMLMWALNSVATSYAGKTVDPFLANLVRMPFGIVMSIGMGRVLARGTEVAIPFRLIKKSLWVFVLEAFGGSVLFIYGLSHSPLAIGSTLASLAPVLSVPVAWALKLERFSIQRTLAVIAVVAGLALLVGGGWFFA
ncbi:DMT family transporter [Bdellovibrionota bacterium FG-1]